MKQRDHACTALLAHTGVSPTNLRSALGPLIVVSPASVDSATHGYPRHEFHAVLADRISERYTQKPPRPSYPVAERAGWFGMPNNEVLHAWAHALRGVVLEGEGRGERGEGRGAKSLCGYEGRIDWRQTLFTATELQ